MNYKYLKTYSLLIVAYFVISYISTRITNTTKELEDILDYEIIQLKSDNEILLHDFLFESKRSQALYLESKTLVKKIETLSKIGDIAAYRKNPFLFNIMKDSEINVSTNTKNIFYTLDLQQNIRNLILDKIENVILHYQPKTTLEIKLLNKRNAYYIDSTYNLNLVVMDRLINLQNTHIKYSVAGKESHLMEIPLKLDYLPDSIIFNSIITDDVTGEKKRITTKLRP